MTCRRETLLLGNNKSQPWKVISGTRAVWAVIAAWRHVFQQILTKRVTLCPISSFVPSPYGQCFDHCCHCFHVAVLASLQPSALECFIMLLMPSGTTVSLRQYSFSTFSTCLQNSCQLPLVTSDTESVITRNFWWFLSAVKLL